MDCIELDGHEGTLRCVLQPNRTNWRVECAPVSMERMAEWSGDLVLKGLLMALRGIPNILVPQRPPKADAEYYLARLPAGVGAWFGANELNDLQSLEAHGGMTVMELWNSAADLCQTLARLYSLGIWGYAGRDRVLLRKGREEGTPEKERADYCLTDITDCQIYQYPQAFSVPPHPETGEDPVTLAMRLLIGGVALCADGGQLLGGQETTLELQLGVRCAGRLSGLFRTPSSLPPQGFLACAQDGLRRAAKAIQRGKPQKLRLYLVLLGPDCRRAAVPALSCVARSFYHCAWDLTAGKGVQADITCVYPWDRVQVCQFKKNCVYGLSALKQELSGKRPVPLGGLLDCLNRELERELPRGTAPLVCYITLTNPGDIHAPAQTCMDYVLVEELARKRELGIFDAFLCDADLRQQVDSPYERLVGKDGYTSLEGLDDLMYRTLAGLLEKRRYFRSAVSPVA